MDRSKMKMMEKSPADMAANKMPGAPAEGSSGNNASDRRRMFMEMIAAKRGAKGKMKGKAKKKPAKKAQVKGKKSKRGKASKSKGSMADQLDRVFGNRG